MRGRMSLRHFAKTPSHAFSQNGATKHGGAVLCTAQTLPHLHALLRRRLQRGAEQFAGHGGRSVRVCIIDGVCLSRVLGKDFYSIVTWTPNSKIYMVTVKC